MLEPILVEEIMTTDPVTIGPTASVVDAARLMLDRRFGALPVVRAGKPVGIITETDLLKHFVSQGDSKPVRKKKRPARKKKATGT